MTSRIPPHAWVDESFNSRPATPLYVLAAVCVEPNREEGIRDACKGLLRPRQKRLHWRDESEPRRQVIAETMAAQAWTAEAAVCTSADGARQERMRRKCMEALYFSLADKGAQLVRFESRGPAADRLDRRMIASLKGSGSLPSTIRVEPAEPFDAPLLWVADALAGAVRQFVNDGVKHLEIMAPDIDLLQITV